MCGINLSLKYPEKVKRMNERTSHRGTTSKEVITRSGIGLGHVRLAIQGLDPKYDCPFEINGNQYLFNGEIYNYKEIDPQAKSDVEILDRDPVIFDGDFAIVRVKSNGDIEIVTDQYGKRQLYYSTSFGKIVGISSEIKALTESTDRPDEVYMQTVARFGYNFGNDRTFVKGIKRFLPGRRYVVRNRTIVREEIIPWDRFPAKEGNLVEAMKRSVERRLVSDVPVAMLYSGGLDSSIVLYHMAELGKIPEVFTCPNEDDLPFAEKYSSELGVKLTKVEMVSSPDVYLKTESVANLGSVELNYGLFGAVKEKGYKVCMTADGADEVFSGYKRNETMDFQNNDIYNELVYYHLPRLDKSSMAHTVEYRSPFTSDSIIGIGLKTPYWNRIGKKILRDSYRGLIPDYILDRRKVPLKAEKIKIDKEKERIDLVKKWNDTWFQKFVDNRF